MGVRRRWVCRWEYCREGDGQGTRLFRDTGRDRALELVESRATPSGVTIQVYRPAGRPEYAKATRPARST
jgi:hypothetical protein